MVEVNEGHRRFPWRDGDTDVIALSRVPELSTWTYDPLAGTLTLGATLTWSEIEREPLRSMLPALAEAARTVGSPQIRNTGTVGGNLATCSPAGDGLPVFAALESPVGLISSAGRRALPVGEFMVGVKRTALAPGEMIESITVPLLDGWQGYSKVGVRNAMVIATASACLATDVSSRSVRIALGSVATTIIRSPEAEAFATEAVDWDALAVAAEAATHFGRLAAASSRPIDDHRSTADYRRHAIAVDGRAAAAARLPGRAFVSEHYRLHVNGVDHDVARWLGWREPAVRAARAARVDGRQGSLRARRVRLVLGHRRRAPGLLVPGAGGVGGRVPDRHCRGAGRARDSERRAARLRRHRSSAVRLLHPGPDHRRPRPARPQSRPLRDPDPGRAVRQRVPLHRLWADHRGGPTGGRRPPRRRGSPNECRRHPPAPTPT